MGQTDRMAMKEHMPIPTHVASRTAACTFSQNLLREYSELAPEPHAIFLGNPVRGKTIQGMQNICLLALAMRVNHSLITPQAIPHK